MGYALEQLVKALLCKPEGRRFDFRWGSWDFSIDARHDPGVDSTSNRNDYQESALGSKGGRCVGLTALLLSCADCQKSWEEPQHAGALTSFLGLYRDSFTFYHSWVMILRPGIMFPCMVNRLFRIESLTAFSGTRSTGLIQPGNPSCACVVWSWCSQRRRNHLKFSLSLSLWRNSPTRARTASFVRFLDHTQRHSTVGRTPLDEGSARRRDFYLTTHNTPKRQTPMPPAGFVPAVLPSERPQTPALDRSATGIGSSKFT